MLEIESKNNNLFKEIKKLKEKKHRIKSNKYLIEGLRFVEEAIKSKVSIDSIIFTESFKEKNPDLFLKINENIKLIQMNEALLKQLCSTENPQGIVGVINMQNKELKSGELVVLVDKVQDPGNMGTIIRTADAVGAHGVIIPKRRSVHITPVVAKASAGAVEYMPVCKVTNIVNTIKRLKEEGLWIAAADMDGEVFYEQNLTGPIGRVIGSEGFGISRLVKQNCDFTVKMPMTGNVASLDASVAGGILLYEIFRQRNRG